VIYKLVAIGRGRPAEMVGENVTDEFFWLSFRDYLDKSVVRSLLDTDLGVLNTCDIQIL